MPEAGGTVGSDDQSGCARLAAEADAMFVEVQRADTKATALSGLVGGLLAADVTLASTVPRTAWAPITALLGAAVLFGAALVMSLHVIRPVLPRGGRLKTFACPVPASGPPRRTGADDGAPEAVRHVRMQSERLALFTALAERKFRIVRGAVDIAASGIIVAGAGLLLLYITV